MDTKQFFSKLDFDPAEIDDLLDNILMDYPDLILDLLRKSSSGCKKSESNKEQQSCVTLNKTEKNEKYKQIDSVSKCELSPKFKIETDLQEETSIVTTICNEDDPPIDKTVPIIEVTFSPNVIDNVAFKCIEQLNNKSKTSPESSANEIKSEINSKVYNSEKMFIESTKTINSSNKDNENKGLESTKFLLRELEEELERLTCVVNETSISPINTTYLSPGFELLPQQSKRSDIRQRHLYLEDPFKKHSSKERPHSAFEQSSLSGRITDQPLSKYTHNIGEDGNEQEMAKCFNLKGTFSLGRYNNQKKNKKFNQDMLMEHKDLQRNTSEHLFKEFRNWQPLHKQTSKGLKGRKRMKHLSAHNLRESSADSERSSMMFEELNTVLDKHLEDNIYFGDKFKSMPEVWSDKQVPSWCKLHMSRHEAVNYLRDKPVRSFVVRNSNSYKGAYGLVLKIAEGYRDPRTGDYVEGQMKNYLIERLPAGVRVKGSPNEPIFPDLASLIKEHCRNPISLPCKLLPRDPVEINLLEESDDEHDDSPLNLSKDVLDSNETLPQINLNCNVLYLSSEHVESLSETAAVRKATDSMYSSLNQKKTTICQLRISSSGLTLTDTSRSLFFRRFYPGCIILYAGINADDQRWAWTDEITQRTNTSRIFGIVTRKNGSMSENTCHLFAELDHSADEVVANVMRLVV